MEQAKIERPTTRRAGGKAATLPIDTRSSIIDQMGELESCIETMVNSEEQGDHVRLVLAHAGIPVSRAIEFFASGEENDATASYTEMLAAESFLLAAAALAAQEHCDQAKPAARWRAAKRLAELSGLITTAQDKYRSTFPGEARAARPANDSRPAAPPVERDVPAEEKDATPARATEADAPGVSLTEEAARLVTKCTYQIETCILMMQEMARRTEDETTGIELPVVVQALGVRIEKLNQCISDTVFPYSSSPSLAELRDAVEGQSPRLLGLKGELEEWAESRPVSDQLPPANTGRKAKRAPKSQGNGS